MRCIISSKDPDELKRAGSILDQAEIEYRIDRTTISDWSSDQYGDVTFMLWVLNEGDIERAKALISEDPPLEEDQGSDDPDDPPPSPPHSSRPLLTLLTVFFCLALFLFDVGTASIAPTTPYSSVTAFYPVRKWLLFDYPSAIALEDSLIEKEATNSLSANDESAIYTLHESSYWGGLSAFLFARITQLPIIPRPTINPHLLFEKVSQGQVWRLFTPALLHGSLLHLLFNMTWLYILGRQIEERLGGSCFLILTLLSGIITNVSQYLMSGYAFLGFSGILLTMAAFIMTRMRLFPQEGFFLEKALYTFLKVVVMGSVILTLLLFGVECYLHRILFSTGFANTAHVIGLLSGLFLGRLKAFSPGKRQSYPQN